VLTVFAGYPRSMVATVGDAEWIYERLGHTLPAQPTADWWAQRWLWLLAPSSSSLG
jgi:hypothetical protein